MCHIDTTAETDGAVTVHCYCGWVEYDHTPESVDAAAVDHHETADADPAATF